MTTKKMTISTKKGVVHHLPHRTRLRVPKGHKRAEAVRTIKKKLKTVPGVQEVSVNERTGSVLVQHDESSNTHDLLGTALEECAGELFEALLDVEEVEFPGLSIIAHFLKSSMGHLDDRVAENTNNWLDLKMLVPIGLFAAGLYKAVRDRGWWGEVPAFVLFYYAYDSYLKFHPAVQTALQEQSALPDGQLIATTDVAVTQQPAPSRKRINSKSR